MKPLTIIGSGGGKSSSDAPTEATNTLRSRANAKVVELIGEGEIVGLVKADGTPVDDSNIGQAVFLNETAVQNADNSFNYKGIVIEQRTGLPDQSYLNGFGIAETPINVSTRLMAGVPLTRTISDSVIDSARVIVSLPALAFLDDKGNMKGSTVEYKVEVRAFGGGWVTAEDVVFTDQKCTSPFQWQTLVTLPRDGAPWDIRVTRITEDSTDTKLQNETHWDSYSEIINGRFTYPDSAVIALTVNSELFGSSIPSRAYRVRGLKTLVPSNYNPVTRVYTGIWDGTLVKAWHSNPAWVLHDLLSNNRYGLGEFISVDTIDKWGLYTIARYCDEMILSGFKDDAGTDLYEPRFSFNGVINNREEAYKVLQDICGAFRGMAYWSLGQVFAASDMPRDAVTTVSPANVIDGVFKYAGTSMKARHSVAIVAWNDPADHFRSALEVVQNDEMLYRFGWRQIEVAPVGVTSRGQAHRFGKWILDTEQNETETVSFTMSWDGYVLEQGATLKPGDIILVADPRKAGGVRTGGRLTAGTTSQVSLDSSFDPTTGITYTVTAILPTGAIETKTISSFSNGNTTLNLSAAFSVAPLPGAMFVIQGLDVNARKYRVLAIRETDKHLFEVSALFHDPNKYARVEQDIYLAPIIYTRPSNIMGPPTNGTVTETNYFENGAPHSHVTLGWSAPVGSIVKAYSITATSPRGDVDFGETKFIGIDLFNITPGDWVFSVVAVGVSGVRSTPLVLTHTVGGWAEVTVPTAVNLRLNIGGTEFTGTAPTFLWDNQFPVGEVVYELDNIIRIYVAGTDTLLRTETIRGTSYTYTFENNINDGGPRRDVKITVTAKSITGVEQETPASLTVTNPTPAAITPVLVGGVAVIDVSYTPNDTDFAGAVIWVSGTAGFVPALTTPRYDGPDTTVQVMTVEGNELLVAGTYYVRVMGYDVFGKTGAIVGPQISVVVSDVNAEIAKVHLDFTETAKTIEEGLSTPEILGLSDAVANLFAHVIELRDRTEVNHRKTKQILSVSLDNANASIGAEMDARVTADEAITTSVTELSATVGTNTADIYTESVARATADSAQATQITALTSSVNSNTSAITTEATTRANADTAQATQITTLTSASNTNAAAIVTEATTRANADSAQSSLITGLTSQVNSNASAIVTEASTRASADSAQASQITALQSTTATTNANLSTELTTRANADNALSASITTLNANLGTTNANVTAETSARVDGDNANASSISSLSTTVGGNTASISSLTTSVNGVSVKYGVLGTINGVTGGFILTGVQKLDGSVSFNMEIQGNLIVTGSITANHMAANSITAGNAALGDASVRTASIQDAAITTAKIGSLQVNTLRIGDNAVIVPVFVYEGAGTQTTGNYAIVSTSMAGVIAGKSITFLASSNASFGYANGFMSWYATLYIQTPAGTFQVAQQTGTGDSGVALSGAQSYTPPNTNDFTVTAFIAWTYTGSGMQLNDRNTTLMVAKR